MSLKPETIAEIPELTAQIARAAFPKGELLHDDARGTGRLVCG
jgi:hypothetical protein